MVVAHFRFWKSGYFVVVYVLRKKKDRHRRDGEIQTERNTIKKGTRIENKIEKARTHGDTERTKERKGASRERKGDKHRDIRETSSPTWAYMD